MRKIFALTLAILMMLALAACGSTEQQTNNPSNEGGSAAVPSGVEDGVLTVAMECAYAPYNWSQPDDSNGAVPIVNSEGNYANGYDVMMAKKLCEANGWKLEVMQLDWDSLVPAVQNGTVDAVIAGQSMTAERMEMVDFAGPYLYATIVCLAKTGSEQANAKGISELKGTCTSPCLTHLYDIFRIDTQLFSNQILQIRKFDYLCAPKSECGQIWLLATTLKNAKMLTKVI